VGSTAPADMFLESFASEPEEGASLGVTAFTPAGSISTALTANAANNTAMHQLAANMFPDGNLSLLIILENGLNCPVLNI